MKCSPYETYDYDARLPPCNCPVCGGFLRWEKEKPICKKCGTELVAIPEFDVETKEELDYGIICPIRKVN